MNSQFEKEVKASLLGKRVEEKLEYTAEILVPISRENRLYEQPYPVYGRDIWNAYEFYYRDEGKNVHVCRCRIEYPQSSPYIVESKSLKLYLNSFYKRSYQSPEQVEKQIKTDLEAIIKDTVSVRFLDIESEATAIPETYICLEKHVQDIRSFKELQFKEKQLSETVYTHTFRSLCPVTSQPDFASIIIYYEGKQIEYESLLSYLVSFSEHQGFHEQCIDQIFNMIASQRHVKHCAVQGLFTRRGGIDINPFRSTLPDKELYLNLSRQ
ncbi:NADPH-dependent 7-cyano-7-deazaguanine reductase QueF [Candidatus Marinamargulisbacteria bacterium SCGC AG-343-D04]|nr:NADPH-dependent 7-cyano-7-deazaguanine reductase QueF [Candidatus Marinamargulisbacteria bacterium SCGC AG-343-D04]